MQDTGGGGGLGSKYYLLILMQFVLQNIFLEKKHCIRLGFNYNSFTAAPSSKYWIALT